MRGTAEERFFAKVIPEPNSGCWLWLGAQHKQGYGQFALNGRRAILAHRASWFIHRGWMPHPDVKVCHSCDTPACVNPDHLWLGSTLDNTRDCIRKGRFLRGSSPGAANGNAILTADDVRNILRDERTGRELAAHYKCAESTIYMIRRGKNWPHIYKEVMGS